MAPLARDLVGGLGDEGRMLQRLDANQEPPGTTGTTTAWQATHEANGIKWDQTDGSFNWHLEGGVEICAFGGVFSDRCLLVFSVAQLGIAGPAHSRRALEYLSTRPGLSTVLQGICARH